VRPIHNSCPLEAGPGGGRCATRCKEGRRFSPQRFALPKGTASITSSSGPQLGEACAGHPGIKDRPLPTTTRQDAGGVITGLTCRGGCGPWWQQGSKAQPPRCPRRRVYPPGPGQPTSAWGAPGSAWESLPSTSVPSASSHHRTHQRLGRCGLRRARQAAGRGPSSAARPLTRCPQRSISP